MQPSQLPLPLSVINAECCPVGVPADVWAEFVHIADNARRAGVERWGARSIIEIMRYENVIKRGNRDFKVNNVFQKDMSRAYLKMRGCWSFFQIRDRAA